jgi:polar amino acid transport system substrate-binding protein
MTPRRTLLAGIPISLAASVVTSTAQAQSAAAAGESTIQAIVKRGRLLVGLSTFVPWAMRDKNGELIGFEVDVSKQIAKDMGVEIDLVPTAFDGIIPALIAAKFDLIATGLSITPKRNLTINFSRPYAHSGATLLANKKLAGDFKTLDDFNKPDVTLAARRGSTGELMVRRLFPKATLRLFDDEQLANQEVINGNAHAASAQPPRPYLLQAKYPDVVFVPFDRLLSSNADAFGIRKGDLDTLNFLDSWTEYHTADRWLEDRHDYWFKSAAWADLIPQ